MQRDIPQPRPAATRLASGPQVHYAERGDPGEPILFLHGYTDRGSPSVGCCRCCSTATAPSPSTSAATVTPSVRTAATRSRIWSPKPWRSWTPSVSSERPWSATRGEASRPGSGREPSRAGHPASADRLGGDAGQGRDTGAASGRAHPRDPAPAEFAREFQAANVHRPPPEAFFEQGCGREPQAAGPSLEERTGRPVWRGRRGGPGPDHGADAAHLGDRRSSSRGRKWRLAAPITDLRTARTSGVRSRIVATNALSSAS